jgi:tetratricopeptide (TPR) repeat protein
LPPSDNRRERLAAGHPRAGRGRKPLPKAARGGAKVDARRAALLAAGIVAITCVVYLGSLGNGFLANWDDDTYVTENPYVKDFTVPGLAKLFTVYYSSNYHPLTGLTNALEYRLFGLSPLPFHLVNLLLHLFNTWLVFRLVRALAGDVEAAGIVALFFGIHPMHVESVAWISERKDVLYAAFYLGALLRYLRYVDGSPRRDLFAALGLFLGALLAKSAAVSLPLVLLAVDWYRGRKLDLRVLAEKVPFFALSAAFGVVALWSQSSGGSTRVPLLLTPIDRLLLPAYALSYYVIKLFVPVGLSAMHYFPAKTGGSLPAEYFAAPLFLAAVAYAAYAARRHRRDLVFGLLFYVATILLVSQVIPFGNAVVAERYTYLPYVGLLFALATFYSRSANGAYGPRLARLKPAMGAVLAAAALASGAAAWSRTRVWESGVTLFSDALAKDPTSYYAYYSRGCERQKRGDRAGAVADYSAAIRLNANYVEAYNNRAFLNSEMGEHRAAEADYTELLRLEPRSEKRYSERGAARGKLGDLAGAVADYTSALALNPRFAPAYHNRGVAREKQKDFDGALADQSEAIRLNPSYPEAYVGRANVRTYRGDTAGAVADYTEALRINPGLSGALLNRAVARYSGEDVDGAIADLSELIRREPRSAGAYHYRGVARLKKQQVGDACSDLRQGAALGSAEAAQALAQYCGGR